ncbi:cyclic nucleotide dependent kinase [Raphidocelis subcapitata]|uniref:cGMP-dependent protein kinase n=1 Tax=Raphidocelis subcapitata TaxID=307507 RepID=A0A2V0NX07_9CHLO|nr:cyclic nucleotide dependent kinase [Raphidocelis subcapitata]|eukprot:GBF90110.1 cyclic nucleotide dependent kinase [Raphidocelis subcapitata]
MGQTDSKPAEDGAAPAQEAAPVQAEGLARLQAITGAKAVETKIKPRGPKAAATDVEFIKNSLGNLLLFGRLDIRAQLKIAEHMWERSVTAGEILIQEGEVGLAASELYVVKTGKFEVLERRKGVNMRVNVKESGDVFGEVSLLYNCPRTATVAATTDAVVWVLERDVFRKYVQEAAEGEVGQIELFLNSVPLLSQLSREAKLRLVDAFVEEYIGAGTVIIREGDPGDKFYIVKSGEALVTQGGKEVNRLFKADFFGERALLSNEPRGATVSAVQDTVCLTLDRDTFVEILGPYDKIMQEVKSDTAAQTRMALLKPRGSAAAAARPRSDIRIRVRGPGGNTRLVVASGHLDEVQELAKGGTKLGASGNGAEVEGLLLVEAALLGEGAFSRVSEVTEVTTNRTFALKRMNKTAALQCPEHVYCEQHISKNTANAFCIRQYASFKDPHHLYFLFDLMQGGDLMDVLVAEAKIIKFPVPQQGGMRQGCLAPKVKMWQGMEEGMAKFYVASIVLALEYLHDSGIVYRDLKPENVLIDGQGFAKLGDFGFAKQIDAGGRTYTFCGTPGYVAPENVLGRGYNHSVDWWTLGVLMYVLLTARQPFSSPKTHDPMEVMRRIVDERWPVKYPPYMSPAGKDLIMRLLERKPAKRIGMLQGRAADIKNHKWFADFDWAALAARRMEPPRRPQESDMSKRKAELEDSHRADPEVPPMTAEEARECEATFKDF